MRKFTKLLTLCLLTLGGTATAYAGVGKPVDRTGWTVKTSSWCDDDGHGNGLVDKLFDGKRNTYWHSNWKGSGGTGVGSSLPEWILVDLGKDIELGGVTYTPRDVQEANGTAKDYKVFVKSAANGDFPLTTPTTSDADKQQANALTGEVASGTFANDTTSKVVEFPNKVTGRYILFVVTSSYGGQPDKFASCAEFNVNASATTVTYNYQLNGKTYGTKTITAYQGSVVPAPATYNFAKPTSYTHEGETLTSEPLSVDVTCTEDLPFKVSDATHTYWYAIDMHSNDTGTEGMGVGATGTRTWLWKNTDATDKIEVENNAYAQNVTFSDAYLWKFTGNLTDGFKIYNKAAGDAKTVTKAETGNKASVLSEAQDHNVFKLYESSEIAGAAAFKADGDDCYINKQSVENMGSILMGWTAADGGSSCLFRPASYFPQRYFTDSLTIGDVTLPAGTVGYADETTAKAAYGASEAAAFDDAKTTALIAANTALKEAQKASIPADLSGYYRLMNSNYSTYAALESDGKLKATTKDADAKVGAAPIFKLTKKDDNYLISVQGKFFGETRQSAATKLVDDEAAAKGYSLTTNGGCKFALKDVTGANYAYLHAGGDKAIVGWETAATATWWYLVPATDLEVSLSAQGESSYATAYLPFSVTSVSGAKAYAGKLNGAKDALNLTEVSSIAARKGVVLVGEKDATKATLTIGEAADATDTDLSGTLTATGLTDDNRAAQLVFGVNEGTVGFYTAAASLTAIPANKAFLPAGLVSATTQAVRLNFGGEATGINGILNGTDATLAPVYDLSGRRVLSPVKGGVYIQSGRKFIVK